MHSCVTVESGFTGGRWATSPLAQQDGPAYSHAERCNLCRSSHSEQGCVHSHSYWQYEVFSL